MRCSHLRNGCGLVREWIAPSTASPQKWTTPLRVRTLLPARPALSPHGLIGHFSASSSRLNDSSNHPTNVRHIAEPVIEVDEPRSDDRRRSPVHVQPISEFEPDDLPSAEDDGDYDETLLAKEFRPLDGALRKKLDGDGGKAGRRKIQPKLQPSFTFAAYVNESPILQRLVHLGVNLTKWEKGRIPDEIVQMDPDRDLAPIVRRLRTLGVAADEDIGKILSQNPFILIYGHAAFKERTDYFLRKKFSQEQLAVILNGAPQLFSRSVEATDARLGFFQKSYSLTGDQLRETVVAHPGLFQMQLSYVQKINFQMNKFLGFKPNEIRELFVTVPTIFSLKPIHLQNRFDQLHGKMMIPHQSLVKFPYLLKTPLIVVKQRHKFLQTLGKANYDPLEDRYTSLSAFTDFDDERFAEEIAGVNYETYKDFLKTQ